MMLLRLNLVLLKPCSSFHTMAPLHSEWMRQQSQAIKMQGDRQAQMIAKREKKKQDERRLEEEHEEVMRNALREREKAMPKDKLDADYFKDYSRFKKERDERDPIYHGLQDKGSEDWGSLLREGIQNSRDKLSKMKESEPLTFSQASMEGARFGYKTYSLGELWHTYQENAQEKKALDSVMNRGP